MSIPTKPAGGSERDTDVDDHPRPDIGEMANEPGSTAGDALSRVRVSAADVAGTLAERAPDALALSQETLDKIAAYLKTSSSDNLVLGMVYSMGLWSGLALARAPRPLLLLAIVPALLLGGTLFTRRVPPGRTMPRLRS